MALVEFDRVAQYRELLTALLTQAETRAARFQRGQNEDLDAADVESLGDLGYVDKAGQ